MWVAASAVHLYAPRYRPISTDWVRGRRQGLYADESLPPPIHRKPRDKVMDYWNENGLVDGNIPAGKPCPWWDNCTMKIAKCPSETNIKEAAHSCALARLNSNIDSGKKAGRKLPLLEKLRDTLGK